MSSQVTLKALGLNYSPNNLSLPEGSLLVADDVFIRRDNVVESRRGFREYTNNFSPAPIKQLLQYKERILAHHGTKLAFDTGTTDSNGKEIFSDFSGDYSETQDGLRIKAIDSNKNLYFTTSEGIKRISARTASDFTTAAGFITPAGAVPALDFTADLHVVQGDIAGFLPADSTVSYRVVWGYKDINNNLILGAPSDPVYVYNYLIDLTQMDFNTLMDRLDSLNQTIGPQAPFINAGNYASTYDLPLNSTADQTKTNIIAVAASLDTSLLWGNFTGVSGALTILTIQDVVVTANVARMTFSAGDPTDYMVIGDRVTVAGLPVPADVLNGNWVLTNVQATYIEWSYVGAVALTAANAGTTLNSYNYTYIVNNVYTGFTDSLNTVTFSSPPRADELNVMENALQEIVTQLGAELPDVIEASLKADYISGFTLTQTATVNLTITIPTNINSNYFVQVYRSLIFTATGSQQLGDAGDQPVTPDDELRLAYETFPTSTDITNGFLTYDDDYPESLLQNNTNLYTNPVSGEGILNANYPPPFAKDLNRFKNTIFYANTKTAQIIDTIQLLGISNIVSGDTLTIADVTGSLTYTFVTGVNQVISLDTTVVVIGDAGEYFTIYSAEDLETYVFWLQVDNTGSQPTVTGATIYVPVSLLSTNTANQNAEKVRDAINTQIFDFTATALANTVTVTNNNSGITSTPTANTSPFINFTVVTPGDGEEASTRQVLLSSLTSAGQAIEETTRSLVRIINKQATSTVNAYYTSNENTPPGEFVLQAKEITDDPFYILANNSGLGASFKPDFSPINTDISVISLANPTQITTTNPHGLSNTDQIMITNTNSTPALFGIYTPTVTGANTFTVPVNVTVAGTQGSWSLLTDIESSTNNVTPNRIFYSKTSQPDAVPFLNYVDVGSEDYAILRIFPIRDSLFVLKEDGLFRISGQIAPWVVDLFDSSCILLAPDSVDVLDNTVYGWTTKGISSISETGAQQISRPIDTVIQKLSSADYSNFSKLTWGVGYNSDESYTVYTNINTSDTVATIGFRYSLLTNTWTNIVRSERCGLILLADDKLYTGAGNTSTPLIHQERKQFNRLDYADRDFDLQLANNNISTDNLTLTFGDVSDISIGDVITQNQTLTQDLYLSLLAQLDADPTVGSSLVSSYSIVGLTCTITTTTNLNLTNGQYITLSNTDSTPNIDGTYQVSNVSGSSFDITLSTLVAVNPTIGTAKRNYSETLPIAVTKNMRSQIVSLATYLDTDPGLTFSNYAARIATKSGTFTAISKANPTLITTAAAHELVPNRVITIAGSNSTPSVNGVYPVSNTGIYGVSTTFNIDENVTTAGTTGTFNTSPNIQGFDDIKACYNDIVNRLNADPGTTFINYPLITDTTLYEAVVMDINYSSDQIVVNIPLQWVVGDVTIYKAIPTQIIYAPTTFEDPLQSKQIHDATFMLNDRAFTKITTAFSSDLKPEFFEVDFYGQGNGIFGHYSSPGFGYGFFGGASNSGPLRTIIPRQTQRCRFINVKFAHVVARERYALYGVTLTGTTGISTRTYR